MPRLTPQVAVLGWLDGQICLISSRNRRRWVLPKGGIDQGRTARDMAAIEAWEEAGLHGQLTPEPVSVYHYHKQERDFEVRVFGMIVTDVVALWPEAGQRQRIWVSLHDAAMLVDEPELRHWFWAMAAKPPQWLPSVSGLFQSFS